MALFGRKKALTGAGIRMRTVQSRSSSLLAAAYRLDISDRHQAARQMRLRQGWQLNAWGYRDQIGELRYALNFLANCAQRMRIFPACYPLGGESDNPVALTDLEEQVPAQVITACAQAMQDLGNGKLAIGHVMHSLSTNKSVAGECFLLGQTDPQTGEDDWSIRSVAEIQIKDERYYLRELPSDAQGVWGAEELNPELTVISRIWTPHPQWRMWADSPMRAMQDDCETLLIVRRGWRADGRSRLAGAGILAIPEELEIKSPNGENADPEADDFLGSLGEAMMMPLDNEGAASAVVPIVVRGPGEQLKNIIHLKLGPQFDQGSMDLADKLIGVIATTIDLPKEVVAGVVDLNHWSAWQVDDNTFRHHVEPHVIHCCDSLTGAFLRPYLEDEGIDPAWVERLLFWYDPVELVTHPDRTQDAQKAYSDMVISGEAYRREGGWSEEDAPSAIELEMRRVMDIRAVPLNLLMEYARRFDPSLVVPPITVAGTVPGIKAGGVDVGEPPAAPAPPAPDVSTEASTDPPAKPPAPPIVKGPPPESGPPKPAPPAITAAAPFSHDKSMRLSRKLIEIDRDLRARLQTAANAALLRQLERAGAKLRTKVARDETMRARIAHRPNERAAAFIGPEALAAAGITATELLAGDFSGLRAQFFKWTADAQKRALALAATMSATPAADSAAQAQSDARDAAWTMLSAALTARSHHLLYSPDPNTQAGDWGELDPDALVPVGTVRAALAIAGGADPTAIATATDGTLQSSGFLGGVATGDTISGVLSDAGGQADQWEWDHAGTVQHPFEPHLDLDGTDFAAFDDEALANAGDFPDNAYYFPGDHDGCTCDAVPLWSFPGSPVNDSSDEE